MNTQKRFFYALSDDFTGDYPKEYTHGFSNQKIAIAFPSKEARDEWVRDTNLLTARPLSRQEAMWFSYTSADSSSEGHTDVLGRVIGFGDHYVRMVQEDAHAYPRYVRLSVGKSVLR